MAEKHIRKIKTKIRIITKKLPRLWDRGMQKRRIMRFLGAL